MDKDIFLPLYKSFVRPHLEFAAPVWNPNLLKHTRAIENVQRRASKLVPGLRNLSYRARLETLNLPNLAYRRYRGDMIEMFKLTHKKYDTDAVDGFLKLQPSRARGHSCNVYKEGMVKGWMFESTPSK